MSAQRHTLRVSTRGPGLVEITRELANWLAQQNAQDGLLTVFCRHTSASLLIQENADPSVQRDLQRFFAQLAPHAKGLWEHDTEGADDMPAQAAPPAPAPAAPVAAEPAPVEAAAEVEVEADAKPAKAAKKAKAATPPPEDAQEDDCPF